MVFGKYYHTITFGCQMNEADTEVLHGLLEALGFCYTELKEEADLLVIVTCAVRQKAEEKVSTLLGRLRSWKKEKTDRILAVGGCMSQQEEVADYIKRKFPYVDIIFGTHSLAYFPDLLKEAGESKTTVVDVEEKYTTREGLPVQRKSSFQAWVPIVYGCNNFCSYCVVPYVRGRERSRNFHEIIKEVRKLGQEGYREITLLGQNVDAYGKDLPEGQDLVSLLQELNQVESINRIRFLTSHPRDFSKGIVCSVAELDKVCEHFHLPLQSGSNRILKKMNRGYSRKHYLELVDYIKDIVPEAAITTDLIVGFPGETEEDFTETMDMVEKIRFDAAYTFVYSPRRKTPAAKMEDDVSPDIKKERIMHLVERQKEIGWEINCNLEGSTLEVLVEGVSKEDNEKLTGRTRTNKLVHFEGPSSLKGKLCLLKINQAKTWHLQGELLREQTFTV